ncbi:hypothetical protein BsWGS_26189 [Bradybaena similaris]
MMIPRFKSSESLKGSTVGFSAKKAKHLSVSHSGTSCIWSQRMALSTGLTAVTNWPVSLEPYSSSKSSALGLDLSSLPKNVREFYEQQDEMITAYENTATNSKLELFIENTVDTSTLVVRMSQISFAVNLALLVAKAVAVGLSNSLSIISSLVDSVVDLISGVIIWWTTHAIKNSNIYVYPIGRSRLEPVAIIILSVVMSLASLEVLLSSIRKMIVFSSDLDSIAVFELPTILIAASTVVIKFTLAVSFYLLVKKKRLQVSAVDALIQDHRNDTLSNTVAIICGYLGSQQFADRVHTKKVAYIDPMGAIIIALYIIISWFQTGCEHVRKVTGYTAEPSFLSRVTWIALNHSPRILCIDTVRAFHFGAKFLVEVDIVLGEETILSESHDIGESLQQKLEKLPEVERAFVHVDFDSVHCPRTEHIF